MPAETSPKKIITSHEDDPHLIHRQGWLRASMMGANDGILSTAALIIGVASGGMDAKGILLAGIAAAAAGAMSMAAGEYVSVASQSDLEHADIERERRALRDNPVEELRELRDIYVHRGLSTDLAQEVAVALTDKDALGSHVRDELGLDDATRARPIEAAIASALAFTAGALPPILVTILAPPDLLIPAVGLTTVVTLATLGALGAHAGNASRGKAAGRVVFWGLLAMGVSAGIGALVGAAV